MKWLFSSALLLIILLLGFLLLKGQSLPIEKQPASTHKKNFWLENDDILLYLEAITQLKKNDVYLESGISRLAVIQDTIKSYLEKTDPYAAFMTAEEFSKWKKSQGDLYVGIGMEIIKNPDGQVVCLPYVGSPAEKAGIRAGDILVSIEDISVHNKSILAIGSMARGEQDTTVKLVIMTRAGKQKSINAKRSHVSFDSVSKTKIEGISVIKIPAFTRDTKTKLKKELADTNKTNPLVIDLRGNAGGDLSASIDSAMLLLGDNKKIVSINTRNGIEHYEGGNDAMDPGSMLYLWQNEGTASAAEVFIAALTQNHRAIAIGKKSFGKGTKQEFFELSNGSVLFLTTGFLQTPDGIFFDGKGLFPDYPVESENPTTAEYLLKVKELILKNAPAKQN